MPASSCYSPASCSLICCPDIEKQEVWFRISVRGRMLYQYTYRHNSDIVEPQENEEWLPFVRTVSPSRPSAIDSRCFSYPLGYIELLYREIACTLLPSLKAFDAMYYFAIS
jgi:hypothetical protein